MARNSDNNNNNNRRQKSKRGGGASGPAGRRIQRELRDINNQQRQQQASVDAKLSEKSPQQCLFSKSHQLLSSSEHCLFDIGLIDENLQRLRAQIRGPPDSPFEGGVFELHITIPDSYPFNPPKAKFVTRLWHPNISSVTGAICLDILKDQWAASLTLRTVLLSLQVLLTSPEPDDPLDAVVAAQYKSDPELYRSTARYWTFVFATPQKSPEAALQFNQFESLVQRLMNVADCDRNVAMSALACKNWNFEEAIDSLF